MATSTVGGTSSHQHSGWYLKPSAQRVVPHCWHGPIPRDHLQYPSWRMRRASHDTLYLAMPQGWYTPPAQWVVPLAISTAEGTLMLKAHGPDTEG